MLQVIDVVFLGTAAIMISAAYQGQEFYRVGYYVINQSLGEPDQPLKIQSISRKIIAENPRVLRFDIEWNKQEGNSGYNEDLLQQTLKTMKGDPFQESTNGLFQQLLGM